MHWTSKVEWLYKMTSLLIFSILSVNPLEWLATILMLKSLLVVTELVVCSHCTSPIILESSIVAMQAYTRLDYKHN